MEKLKNLQGVDMSPIGYFINILFICNFCSLIAMQSTEKKPLRRLLFNAIQRDNPKEIPKLLFEGAKVKIKSKKN